MDAFMDVYVRTDSEASYLMADVPGVDLDTLEVTVEGRHLHIRGVRKNNMHVNGRDTTFFRALRLTDALDADALTASVKNGVLTIRVPYLNSHKPRKVEVVAE